MNVRTVSWRTRTGKKRTIRLYGAWNNIKNRVAGRTFAGNGQNLWAGKEVAWKSFKEFRAWALANGYSKLNCSPDRKKPSQGYTPSNCRWLTREQNTRWQNLCAQAVDPDFPDVPF